MRFSAPSVLIFLISFVIAVLRALDGDGHHFIHSARVGLDHGNCLCGSCGRLRHSRAFDQAVCGWAGAQRSPAPARHSAAEMK